MSEAKKGTQTHRQQTKKQQISIYGTKSHENESAKGKYCTDLHIVQ